MSNTEFNATNGEQNSVQTLTSDNVAQENAVQSEPQKPLKLGEFCKVAMARVCLKTTKGSLCLITSKSKTL